MAIETVRVQDCWDKISPEIDSIMNDLPWKDFRKEEIYAACAGGTAAVFIDTDFPLGESFFVARIDENSSTGERVMLLWIAHSKVNETADRVTHIVSEIAQNSGCSAVEFVTGSKEVMEYGIGHDFEKVMYRCRREVTPRENIDA